LGGTANFSDHREFGYAEVRAHGHTRPLDGPADFTTPAGPGSRKAWTRHGDKATALPPAFARMASTPARPSAARADASRASDAAALIHKAIGDPLTCVFVDHGLLRLDEGKQVMQTFAENMGVKIVHIDATGQFMGKLAGQADPEAKRKIIGREFVEVFQAEA